MSASDVSHINGPLTSSKDVQVNMDENRTDLLASDILGDHVSDVNRTYQCTDNATYEEMQSLNFVRWIVEGIILIIISFSGLVSNLIAIPVLLSRELINRFNRILAVLAVLDAAYNFFDILESIRNQHYPYFSDNQCGPKPHYVFLHDYVFCRLLYPLQNIVMMASIYATVIVAFERYVAVSRPISTYIQDGSDSWRKTFFYIFPMSLFSLAFNFSKFFEYCGTEDRMECPEPTTSYNPTTVHENGGGNDATKCFYFVYADLTVNGKYHENILA